MYMCYVYESILIVIAFVEVHWPNEYVMGTGGKTPQGRRLGAVESTSFTKMDKMENTKEDIHTYIHLKSYIRTCIHKRYIHICILS